MSRYILTVFVLHLKRYKTFCWSSHTLHFCWCSAACQRWFMNFSYLSCCRVVPIWDLGSKNVFFPYLPCRSCGVRWRSNRLPYHLLASGKLFFRVCRRINEGGFISCYLNWLMEYWDLASSFLHLSSSNFYIRQMLTKSFLKQTYFRLGWTWSCL